MRFHRWILFSLVALQGPESAGAPIAADINGDGASEILLPLSDGSVHVFGSQLGRRALRFIVL